MSPALLLLNLTDDDMPAQVRPSDEVSNIVSKAVPLEMPFHREASTQGPEEPPQPAETITPHTEEQSSFAAEGTRN